MTLDDAYVADPKVGFLVRGVGFAFDYGDLLFGILLFGDETLIALSFKTELKLLETGFEV